MSYELTASERIDVLVALQFYADNTSDPEVDREGLGALADKFRDKRVIVEDPAMSEPAKETTLTEVQLDEGQGNQTEEGSTGDLTGMRSDEHANQK